ncbi:DUF4837 family protein [Lutibacter sp.]|uniref:DUF4837 family protein n=1 Tax=Lutibacter sp. TaxID=1925666 RepID=UPI0025C6ABD2|nr:DUF4837 family protein [Lutibacter sp.]MCF6181433.1 DUF4837 family protein [Lutibacter sp.]
MKKLAVLFTVFTLLFSCNSGKDKIILQESNGRINHILIIMKNSEWKGDVGDAIRKILTEPVVGLPQPEPLFEITQVPENNFGAMFKASRSVLRLGITDKNLFNIATNVYADPQKIITITGKSKKKLIAEINKNSQNIIAAFKKADIHAIQKRVIKKYYNIKNISTFKKHGYSLKIPKKYRKVEDTGDFIWYRYHLTGGNSMELISYTYPIKSENDINGNNIVAKRDSIGKIYIPGAIKNSYMITEAAYTPHMFQTKIASLPAIETRGKWEVKGVYMAGPFLNYSVIDKAHNRVIVVEGFTFAPSINKRDYMFELEAILKTLKVN